MSYWSEHWLALVALLAYALALAYNAYTGQRRSTSVADYYVGGRRLGGLVLGVSFFATYASTNSYIGNAGKGYSYGAPWLLMVVMMLVFTYLSWRFVAPRMRRFTAAWGSVTLPDYIVARFIPAADAKHKLAKPLRLACGLVVVFASLLYLLAIFKGSGNLLQLFLGVRYEVAVAVSLVIVVLYTSVGGFHSVVRTDLLQGTLMLFGAVSIFYCVTQAAGGVGVLVEMQSEPATAHLFTRDAGVPLVVLIGIALAGSLKLLVDPRQLSRFYGLKDERSVRVGLWTALIGIAVIQFCLFPIGIYAHQLLSSVPDTDLIVPILVNDPSIFPLWLSDLLIVAILAAAMSSMDSVLLVAASVFCNDLWSELRPAPLSAKQTIAWTRGFVVLFAVAGALLALRPPGGIVEITIFSGSLYAVCFLPAVLLGLHWRRGTASAVLASMGLGVLTLLVWRGLGYNAVLHEVFPALLLSVGVYVGISCWSKPALQQWPDQTAVE